MTLWERRTHPKRSRELGILATACATLALGCAVAAFRHGLPGIYGSLISNSIMLSGYLLIVDGVSALNGRNYRVHSLVLLAVNAFAWILGGTRGAYAMWAYGSALPIAIACGMTTRELLYSDSMKSFQSRRIAALVAGIHAAFYAFRSLVLPWLVTVYGVGFLSAVGQITMYEGVLFSVVLPMTLLRLVREESHGQLVRESQTDYLTGLGNRRRFFEEGARVFGERDAARPVSLLAFDLDHFKTINDQHGHETGDAVLKSFGDTARSLVGSNAILARIGGEEFAALLPGLDGPQAREVGEAIVKRFAATISHGASGAGIRATVSGGLAQTGSDASTLAQLLAAADNALYRAKSLGGNRLELAQAGARPGASHDESASRDKKTAV
jgi:diguanylate cyclase (GGDEF)-like protein